MRHSSFAKTFFAISIPIAIQNLLASFLNLVDNVMVGRLGDTAIAAVSQANQLFFLLNLALFGTCSGMQILAAQFWGKRDIPNIKKVLGLGLLSVTVIALLGTAVGLFLPRQFISLFSHDATAIALGVGYERIVAVSFLFTAISLIFSAILRSVEQVKLPLFATIFSLLVNIVLNYLLIFGKWGFPELGVNGAAVATLTARVVECLIIVAATYFGHYPVAARAKELFSFTKSFAKNCYKVVLPVTANETLWSLGLCTYAAIYGYLGTPVVAATNIVSTVQRLVSAFFFGSSYAASIMIGKAIGAHEQEKAYRYAKLHMIIGTVLGALSALVMILSRDFVLSFFEISPEALYYGRIMMVIYGVSMVFQALNVVGICGVLRAGGDTKIALIIDTSTVWLLGLPLGIITTVMGLPAEWVYLAINAECVVKFALLMWRFMGNRWMRNVVDDL